MSDKDEFTDKFHEMRSRMVPSPELISRVEANLEADAQADTETIRTDVATRTTDVASGPIAARTSARHPSAKPEGTRKPSRPRGKIGSRIGLFSGGATALVLASVMLVGHLASPNTAVPSPWPTWPDPLVVSGNASGSNNSARSNVPVAEYAGVYQALAATSQYQYSTMSTTNGALVPMAGGVEAGASGDMAAGTNGNVYTSDSGTNVQVAGIDEGDIVKTDGANLYVAKGRTVAVVSAQGADSHQIATIEVAGLVGAGEIITGPVMDMMIQDTTLVVLFHGFTDNVPGWSASWGDYLSLQATSLKAAFFDISDPGHPRYLSQVSQSGTYVDSRLFDGMLYVVTRYSVNSGTVDPVQPVTYVPTVDSGNGPIAVDPGDISIIPGAESASYAVVTAIDVDARRVMSEQAVLGGADTIYMSTENLYLASTRWSYAMLNPSYEDQTPLPKVTIPGFEGYQDTTTNLVRIGLNSGKLSVEADAVLPGTLLNQFAMDEQDGYLRIVTTRNNAAFQPIPGLWILDPSLHLAGSLPELVTKEQVQSVRFDGNTGYVVTFERVDPLFAIDLSDPTDPEVRSALKIPGFSSYLHPFGPGLLLGIGTDANESGQSTGLKLSMFNVSDPYDVQEASTIQVDGDSTDAAYDHKAAFVDIDCGLIGFPTMTYANTQDSISTSWDYRIYKWTGTEFVKQSTINLFHSEDGAYPNDTTTRAVLLDDFYLLTNSVVDAYTLDDYVQIAHVTLT